MTGKKILSALIMVLSVATVVIVTVLIIITDAFMCCYNKLVTMGKALSTVRRKRKWIKVPPRSREWY